MTNHTFYTADDFTHGEADRRNQVYVMVVEGGLQICKGCGAAEAELSEFPTCASYNEHQRRRREGGLGSPSSSTKSPGEKT